MSTPFFHAQATKSFRRKSIKCLKDEQGGLIQDYFRGIFTSIILTPSVKDECLTCLMPMVSVDANAALLHHYTADEVRQALNQMHPLKSPGLHDMSPGFFQKFWSIVDCDTTSCVLYFLNEGSLDPRLNATNITLLPKCVNPKIISLCNVVYKITSKAIVNSLKPLLSDIISLAQSVFVSGRLITDNVPVAHEINHFLANKYWGKTGDVSFKLDISKAYDWLKWSFLKRVLSRLGFHEKVVCWIMTCVSTVSYSFLLNGVQFGSLHSGWGSAKGTPLSLFIFILCRGLSNMIREEEL
ncbi:UNVERIFIED_CONTAM: hypothetical protein Sradi_4848100 [Sesamum radiatum]|uniref:Reverse transcriptase domain-containing protein n=1 Tax=Sesamum radiatum TaxID=300843 RepID=A0AAW2MXA8_SESRA